MKNFIAGLIGVLMLSGVAVADEPVLNDPQGFYEKTKAVVKASDPRVGAFWNVEVNEWQALTAAEVYTKEINGYELSGVLGYGVNKTLVGAIETDVFAGIGKLTGSTIKIPWISVNVGFGTGYSWDSEDFVYGYTFDVSKKW